MTMSEENILSEFEAFLNKSAMLAPAATPGDTTPAPIQSNTAVALGQAASRQADVPPPPASTPKPVTSSGKGLGKSSF